MLSRHPRARTVQPARQGCYQSTCKDCAAGKYYDKGAFNMDCIAGKFSAAIGATSASTCVDCTAGKFYSSGAPSESTCKDCPPASTTTVGPRAAAVGKYSAIANSTSTCTACPAGKYSGSLGVASSALCFDCAPGRYSHKEGAKSSATCLPCSTSTASTSVQLPRIHVRTVRRANTALPQVLTPIQAVWLAKKVVILLTQA